MKQQLKTIFSRDHPFKVSLIRRCKDCIWWEKFAESLECFTGKDAWYFENTLSKTAENCDIYRRKPFLWIFHRFWRLK